MAKIVGASSAGHRKNQRRVRGTGEEHEEISLHSQAPSASFDIANVLRELNTQADALSKLATSDGETSNIFDILHHQIGNFALLQKYIYFFCSGRPLGLAQFIPFTAWDLFS